MRKQRILVVEDDVSILIGLVDLLNGEGYEVTQATDGREAIRQYELASPSLILLDIMLPEKSGYEVCRQIRKKDSTIPILMLTAKGQEVDKVVGLELGADDYIVKPFSINELLARVRAALRRAYCKDKKPEDKSPIAFGDVYVDPKTFEGRKGKKHFRVTLREVQLLRLMTSHDGEVLRRDAILDELWGFGYEGTTRTLDQHIVKLRQKVEDDPSHPRYITTVHGVGYRFDSR